MHCVPLAGAAWALSLYWQVLRGPYPCTGRCCVGAIPYPCTPYAWQVLRGLCSVYREQGPKHSVKVSRNRGATHWGLSLEGRAMRVVSSVSLVHFPCWVITAGGVGGEAVTDPGHPSSPA